MAGDKGVIAIAWYDPETDRSYIACGCVGENGILANTPYVVKDGVLVPKG